MTPIPPTSALPDPQTLADDLSRGLAILLRAKAGGDGWITAAEIARRLLNDHGVRVHWRTIEALLSRDASLAARRKRQGRREFSITKAGENMLGSSAPIVVVDPARALQAVVSLHDLLNGRRGTVRVCDAYLDHATIEHLDACDPSVEIRLLSKNVDDKGKLRRVVAATKAQGRNLAIRVAPSAPLHDRYIIDDKEMVILGTSLNQFGRKQCFVTKAGPDLRAAMVATFDGIWSSAQTWP